MKTFLIGNDTRCNLDELLAANADDTGLCEWARDAKPGDTFPDGEGCECVGAAAEEILLGDNLDAAMWHRPSDLGAHAHATPTDVDTAGRRLMILDGRERRNPAANRKAPEGIYAVTRADGTGPGDVRYYGVPHYA